MEAGPKTTRLPDDWRLSPEATRKRTLFSALSPSDQRQELERAKKRARQRAKAKRKK